MTRLGFISVNNNFVA